MRSTRATCSPTSTRRYGRKLDIEFYVRTGLDESAQRADALAIAEKKPFAVLSALETTGDVLAQKQDHHVRRAERPEGHRTPGAVPVVVVDRLLRDDAAGRRSAGQAGVGRQGEVGGRRVDAQQDPQVRASSTRAAATPCPYPDLAVFEKTLKKYGGGTIATKIEYTGATGADTATVNTLNQQNAVPLITKLKDAGVTTVVAIASSSMLAGLTKAATQQEYNPEWFCAEWFNCSFDYFARQLDQQQWAHAFGVGSLYPAQSGDAVDGQTSVVPVVLGHDPGFVQLATCSRSSTTSTWGCTWPARSSPLRPSTRDCSRSRCKVARPPGR